MELLARLKLFWPQQVGVMHYKKTFRTQFGITFAYACLINSTCEDRKKDAYNRCV